MFSFFIVEIILGFISAFVAIFYATLYPFDFTYIIKLSPLYIINVLVNTFRNQDKKLIFIRLDKDGVMARSSESMRTFHNMNIIFQNPVYIDFTSI